MRLSLALVLVFPALAVAQPAAAQKQATVKWVLGCEAPDGGFYLAPQDPKSDAKPQPMLRATNGAVRALKYLGAEVPNKEKHAAFVLKCYDPKTGAFAEPGGKPDVTITSVGVMAAAELGIPHEKYATAMDYLKDNAKTFEEVRIAAAAVEAWGLKTYPHDLKPWFKIASELFSKEFGDARDGGARDVGSVAAMLVRLGVTPPPADAAVLVGQMRDGQRDDGGWGKKGETASDIETTYRVMRALMLLKEKPKDAKKLREFLDAHRNKDGGYATKPGDPSSMSGVYYCVIVSKWLDDMEAKK